MKQYLSYGGGVNSTAMLLLLHDEGQEFESIYVDHGCDWPETREYVQMMAERYPITILKPNTQGFDSVFDYAWEKRVIPSAGKKRWCTDKFKMRPFSAYVKKPCFSLVGFSVDESQRAHVNFNKGIENRFPLLEREIDRNGCVKIIKAHRLPVPMKSGCFICPFQRVGQWRLLRRRHPDLFCKAKQLEEREIERRIENGKKPLFLADKKKTLLQVVRENQETLWEDMKPPCQCGL